MDKMPQLLLIGLDGATWDILRPAMRAGKLPFLASRVGAGASGILLSTIPCRTSPALPTLFTGKNPGSTGLFDFVKSDGSPVSSADIGSPFLWEIANRSGKTACVVNVRFTYPPRPLDGVLICGGLTHVPGQSYTYPPAVQSQIEEFHSLELQREIERLIGDLDANRDRIYSNLKAQYRRRLQVFKQLLSKQRYDLAILWIGTTDAIQHYCWGYQDLVVQYFQMVDEDLKHLCQDFPDANFIVVSDHGFAAAPTQAFYANTWLRQLGYLRGRWSWLGLALRSLSARAQRMTSPRLKRRIKRLLSQRARSPQVDGKARARRPIAFSGSYGVEPGVQWEHTIAFLDCKWGIAIKPGIPEDQKERILNDIIDRLRDLRDPAGQRVIQSVWRREELYKGEYVDELPEIVFLTAPQYTARPYLSPQIFGPDPQAPKNVSGAHDTAREGIFIAWGPDIRRDSTTIVDISDVTPTALQLMGCALPDNLDGSVLSDIFDPNSRAAQYPTVRTSAAADISADQQSEADAYSPEETEVIKQRLRDLGYLD